VREVVGKGRAGVFHHEEHEGHEEGWRGFNLEARRPGTGREGVWNRTKFLGPEYGFRQRFARFYSVGGFRSAGISAMWNAGFGKEQYGIEEAGSGVALVGRESGSGKAGRCVEQMRFVSDWEGVSARNCSFLLCWAFSICAGLLAWNIKGTGGETGSNSRIFEVVGRGFSP